MPPDESKELELLNYLSRGGRLMSLNDPMVAALAPDLFAPMSLRLPEGLTVDQTMNWAGTEDTFIVSEDFPAHPATLGMRGPVVFPLAGAVFTRDIGARSPSGGTGGGPPADSPRDAATGTGPGGPGPGSAERADGPEGPAAADGPGTPGEPAPAAGDDAFLGHTWAVALTSGAAFLETDRESIGRREPRFDRDADPAGPMVLASATTLAGGGRLVLAADSDFASNAYIGFAGNLDFATGLLSWLVGDEDDLTGPRRGTVLMVTDPVARFFFWGPVVFWPLLTLAVWGTIFLRRRRASA
jgi:hypothetical protein